MPSKKSPLGKPVESQKAQAPASVNAQAPDAVKVKAPLNAKPQGKGAKVQTSNETFLELLPDERISRHAALKMMRGYGLGCSQARMGEIILIKYGPQEPKANGQSQGGLTPAEREAKAKIIKESEAKALADVRAKRAAAAKGEKVAGYAAESVKYDGPVGEDGLPLPLVKEDNVNTDADNDTDAKA